MGGFVDTYPTTIFTARACWRQPVSGTEVEWWQQRGVEVTHRVFFADNPNLDENCVLEFGNDILEVTGYAEPDSSVGLGILWRLMVKRITVPVSGATG